MMTSKTELYLLERIKTLETTATIHECNFIKMQEITEALRKKLSHSETMGADAAAVNKAAAVREAMQSGSLELNDDYHDDYTFGWTNAITAYDALLEKYIKEQLK